MAAEPPVRPAVFQFFSARAGDALVHGLAERLEEIFEAADLAARIDALVALMDWWRAGIDQRALLEERRSGTLPAHATERVRMLLDLLGANEGLRARFQDTLGAILLEAHGVNLFAEAGIPSDRGFVSEFGDRLADKFVPAPRDDHDLASLLGRVYRSAYHVERVRRLDGASFDRLLRLLYSADRPQPWSSVGADPRRDPRWSVHPCD